MAGVPACRWEPPYTRNLSGSSAQRRNVVLPWLKEFEMHLCANPENHRGKSLMCRVSSSARDAKLERAALYQGNEGSGRIAGLTIAADASLDSSFESGCESASDSEVDIPLPVIRGIESQIKIASSKTGKISRHVRTPRYLQKTHSSEALESSTSDSEEEENVLKGMIVEDSSHSRIASKARAKAESFPNMARHRTHSLTKTITQKSPWISHAIERLRRSKKTKQQVRSIMDDVQDKIDPGAVYVILNELQRLHEWKAVVELGKWIKQQPWHTPSERFYNMLIGFLGREGQPDEATLLFEEMLLDRVRPNNYTFTALINAYGRARMFREALEVFDHMKSCDEEECWPNTVTCNALIGALCRGKKYEEAVVIFSQMKSGSAGLSKELCKPSIFTYNTLIDAMCREGKIEDAVDVLMDLVSGQLDDSVQPDTVTYNIIIDSCGKSGMASKAEKLVQNMRSYGLRPDNATYTALIDAYGKAGEPDKAENTFRAMQRFGVKADVMTYTAVISSLGRNGFVEKAEELFKEMLKRRVKPNEVTFLALIDAQGKSGNPRGAERILKEMQGAGFRPNIFTYGAMMDCYGKSGEYHLVVKMFQEMKREGCRPNLITYAALMTSCAKCENWEDALLMLYCLQQSGSEWELCMCRLLLGGPEEEDDIWENSAKMFEGMQRFPLSMRRSFYNALIDALWSYGLRERAAKVAAVGRILEVYGDDMFVFARSGDSSEWKVDLHDNSVGSAVTHFYSWLTELRLAWQWQDEVPKKISVVTGWGKHTSARLDGESPLKYKILEELQCLGSPFEECRTNAGRIVASGKAVKSWLMKPEMEGLLLLKDSVNPRPVGELPYEHL